MLEKFGIRAKLLLYLVIPLMTILLFATTSFVGRYNDLTSSQTSLSFINMSTRLAELSHQLQKERIASRLYSLNRDQGSLTRLMEEYDATNNHIQLFSELLDVSDPEVPFWGLHKEFQFLVVGLKSLEAARRAVLSDHIEASPYYNDIIAALLDIFSRQGTFTNSVELVKATEASRILLELMEKASQEQDEISSIIVRGRIDAEEYQSISALKAEQLVLQQRFLELAEIESQQSLRRLIDQSVVSGLRDQAIRHAIDAATHSDLVVNLQNRIDQQADAQQFMWVDSDTLEAINNPNQGNSPLELDEWLDTSSENIEWITGLQVQTQSSLRERFAEAVGMARFALASYLLIALTCLLSSLLIGYLLVARFVTSLAHIRSKLNEMKSRDDLDIQIALPGNDEIGEMASAFDRLLRRRKFLEQERACLQDELFKVQESQNRVLEDRVKQRTQELDLALRKAEAANEAKRVFLGNISHHIRTPLNSILGNAQLILKENDLTTDFERRVTNITEQGNELLLLVNDVLEIISIQGSDSEEEKTEFDISQLCQQLQNKFTRLAADKCIRLDFEIAESLSPVFRTNEQKLYRVLDCLVGNAIQHSCSESVAVKIEPTEDMIPSMSDGGVGVMILIIDHGIGIDAEYLDAIQNPFEQVTPGCDSTDGGLGLGLSIVAKFVSELGGEMVFESHAGCGTRVSVTLPGIARLVSRQEKDATEETGIMGDKILTPDGDRISVERLQAIAPASWDLMLAALDCADFLAIQEALQVISEGDARVGEAIRHLVESFDYDGIRQLIPETKVGLSLAL